MDRNVAHLWAEVVADMDMGANHVLVGQRVFLDHLELAARQPALDIQDAEADIAMLVKAVGVLDTGKGGVDAHDRAQAGVGDLVAEHRLELDRRVGTNRNGDAPGDDLLPPPLSGRFSRNLTSWSRTLSGPLFLTQATILPLEYSMPTPGIDRSALIGVSGPGRPLRSPEALMEKTALLPWTPPDLTRTKYRPSASDSGMNQTRLPLLAQPSAMRAAGASASGAPSRRRVMFAMGVRVPDRDHSMACRLPGRQLLAAPGEVTVMEPPEGGVGSVQAATLKISLEPVAAPSVVRMRM